MDFIDLCGTFHTKVAEHAFFSNAHTTFSRVDRPSGHITSLTKFLKIEIISSAFSDHNDMKIEINHKKNTEKHAHVEAEWHSTRH